jgi:hypothetical protein
MTPEQVYEVIVEKILRKIAYVIIRYHGYDLDYFINWTNESIDENIRYLLENYQDRLPFSLLERIERYEDILMQLARQAASEQPIPQPFELPLVEEEQDICQEYFLDWFRTLGMTENPNTPWYIHNVQPTLSYMSLISGELRKELRLQEQSRMRTRENFASTLRSIPNTQDFPSRFYQTQLNNIPDVGPDEEPELFRMNERPSRFRGGLASRFEWLEPHFRNTQAVDNLGGVYSRAPYSRRTSDGSIRKKSSKHVKRTSN